MEEQKSLVAFNSAKENFSLALKDAQQLDIVNNVGGAFDAAIIVGKLEAVLTDEVMKQVFMPLMNKKIGFRTDQDPSHPTRTNPNPKPYSVDVVRTCIIDAAAIGLLPTGNQFNIISGNMYPTKEGYTSLLTRLKSVIGLQYMFEFDPEATAKSSDPQYVAIPCRISYKTKDDNVKGWFKYVALVKSNGATSSTDQLRGKAERKCKKAFFEFLTGIDLGDADATEYTEITTITQPATPATPNYIPQSAAERAKAILNKRKGMVQEQAPEVQQTNPVEHEQPQQIDISKMSDEQLDEMMNNVEVNEEEGGEQ